MDNNLIIQTIIILLFLIIGSIIYFKKMKSFNVNYIFFLIISILAGGSLYAGIVWILKPYNLIQNVSIYDEALYNWLVGLILISFSIISVKDYLNNLTTKGSN